MVIAGKGKTRKQRNKEIALANALKTIPNGNSDINVATRVMFSCVNVTY
jgi:hypothetical protein